MPKKNNLEIITASKTGYKCIGTILAMLKIDSKCLKTCIKSSYSILKISQTTSFSSACQPAVRPGSTSARTPDFCHNHCTIVGFMNLLFRKRFLHCALLPPLMFQSFPLFTQHVNNVRNESWWRLADPQLVPVNYVTKSTAISISSY